MQAAVQARNVQEYDAIFMRRIKVEEKMYEIRQELVTAKINAAEHGIIYTSTLSGKLDKDNIEAIEKLLSQAPENIRKVWNMHEDRIEIADTMYSGTAHYSHGDGVYFDIFQDTTTIYGRPKFSVFFHENGHQFDDLSGMLIYYSSEARYDLTATLKSEVEDHIQEVLRQLKVEAVAYGKSAKDIKKQNAYEAVEREIKKIPQEHRRGLSDMFSGCTLNKVDGGYGHSTTYWKNNPEYVSVEFFAETYSSSIVNPEAIEVIKQYFPRSYAKFESILEGMVAERK